MRRRRLCAGERLAGPGAGARQLLRTATLQRWMVVLAVTAAVAAVTACSSVVSDGDDPWTASYVGDADRVWAAIHRALDALGYAIEEEDRGDGTIRAEQAAERPYEAVVLHIAQVQRAEVVRVDVRPAGGVTGTPYDYRSRDDAVREFIGELDRQLGRHLVR